jgi:hypothetical protein
VANDAPLKRAWDQYQKTDDYANTRKWAIVPEHVDGSLWAAFMAGFQSRDSNREAVVSGIWLRRSSGGDILVLAERESKWYEIIRETGNTISHIAEPLGIRGGKPDTL